MRGTGFVISEYRKAVQFYLNTNLKTLQKEVPMKLFKISFLLFSALFLALYSADCAYANKSSVAIEAPESAALGSEVTIKITVTHSANNFIHYTNWVYVMVNGKEVERWKYSWNKKPSDANFTREIKYKVTGPVEIKAEANCNIHGSTGPTTKTISVR
jgi:desulfoferrodoxin (superoxide reductase-like protein)